MTLATTLALLEPGRCLRTALETETYLRLISHPLVVESPTLGSNEIGSREIENGFESGNVSLYDTDEGVVLVMETRLAFITLYPDNTLTRRMKCEGAAGGVTHLSNDVVAAPEGRN